MSDFDALLKRSFAEAHEPADDGFSASVTHAVARREKALQLRAVFHNLGMALGGAAALYGVYAFVGAFGPDVVAALGLEIARLHGSLSAAPPVGEVAAGQAQGFMQTLGLGLTQALMLAGVVAGGAVALRMSQQD